MKSKQELLVDVLAQRLANAKVGVIVRGIIDIDPVAAVEAIATKEGKKYYVAAVGYAACTQEEHDLVEVSSMI